MGSKNVRKGWRLVSRDLVETIAKIIGPSSAAASAIREADRRGGKVDFWDTGGSWVVTDQEGDTDAQV